MDPKIINQQMAKSSEVLTDNETKVLIQEAFKKLSAEQKQAIRLRIYENISYGSIAEKLGCSEVTARSYFHRGKQRLSKTLDRMEIFDN